MHDILKAFDTIPHLKLLNEASEIWYFWISIKMAQGLAT